MQVNLTLPELPCNRLGDLRRGAIFMSKKDSYSSYVSIYMVLKNDFSTHVTVVELQNGETRLLSCNLKVIQLDVTIQCKPHDPDALPF